MGRTATVGTQRQYTRPRVGSRRPKVAVYLTYAGKCGHAMITVSCTRRFLDRRPGPVRAAEYPTESSSRPNQRWQGR